MKAADFLKKMKFVENIDSEMEADKAKQRDLEEEDDVVAVAPGAQVSINTDDDQILAVMNGYFKHVNTLSPEDKAHQLQDLTHRMANSFLGMPGGEKALRSALKGAVGGMSPAAPAMESKKKKRMGESAEVEFEVGDKVKDLGKMVSSKFAGVAVVAKAEKVNFVAGQKQKLTVKLADGKEVETRNDFVTKVNEGKNK